MDTATSPAPLSVQIARLMLENFAGVYYTCPPLSHVRRNEIVLNAALTAELKFPQLALLANIPNP